LPKNAKIPDKASFALPGTKSFAVPP